MTWQDHIAFDRCEAYAGAAPLTESRMTPGLTGNYDEELREKASVRSAPIAPEYMGLEGQYDSYGLARRVAAALDEQPALASIETLDLIQRGSTIVFTGQVADQAILRVLVDTASQVDGTRGVEVGDVVVEQAYL